MPGSDVRDTSAWAPFRHETFRALWIAQFVSNVGTWMQSVGAVWVMVELKGSPTEVALVQTATTLPVVFFGVLGGAMADLADRRRVLLATQAMMLAAAGTLALLDRTGAVSPLSLLALTFALGIGTALNNPAWQAIQPELVPRDEFPQAVTLGGASDQPRSRDRPGARRLPRRRCGTVVRVLIECTVVLCGDRRAGPLASEARRHPRAARTVRGSGTRRDALHVLLPRAHRGTHPGRRVLGRQCRADGLASRSTRPPCSASVRVDTGSCSRALASAQSPPQPSFLLCEPD